MSQEDTNKPQADEGTPPVDSAAADPNTAEAATTEVAAVEAEPTELTIRASEGQRFLNTFGDQGGVWFAQGKTFEEATQLQMKFQADRIAELETKLAASKMGEEEPVKFQPSQGKEKKSIIRIAGRH